MCRWMAWSGERLLMQELPLKTQDGLIDQSLHPESAVLVTGPDVHERRPLRPQSVEGVRSRPRDAATVAA
jgi:hypothetical protein